MIAELLAVAALLAPQGSAYERSLEATSAGDYAAALAAADELDAASVERARARLWALWSAGYLDLALDEAERGLELGEDAWLRARAVEIALGLHDAHAAQRHQDAWQGLDLADDRERVASAPEVERLARQERSRRTTLSRARWTSLAVASACVAALVALARTPRRDVDERPLDAR